MKKCTLQRYWASFAAAFIGFGCLGVGLFLIWYIHQPIKLRFSLSNISVHSSISVTFSHQVGAHLSYNLSPGLPGVWKTTSGLLGISKITFYPTTPLTPGTKYTLSVGYIAPVGLKTPIMPVQEIPISVQPPPSIASISPSNGASGVLTTSGFTIALAEANNGLRKLTLNSDAPLVSSQPTTTDNVHYSWHFAAPLAQGTTYHVSVIDLNQKTPGGQRILASSFTTVPEPHIITATQHDHFYPGDTITVGFDQAMNPAATVLNFTMTGSGHWLNPQTYQFTPTSLPPGQTYGYSVGKGSTATNGGMTTATASYAIATPGAAYVTSASPGGANVAISTPIKITFDQPVDHASAQAAFSIAPSVSGSFSWNDNTLIFQPVGLAYQTGYTVAIQPGVKGLYGLPETQGYSHGFTTTYQVITLNVPLFHQVYTESCEEAALRMALALYGVNVSDFEILQHIGYNPEPRNMATNTWDNPYQTFVGDVNGIQDTTGYGVFAPPIAAAAISFGRGATVANSVSASYIAQQIYNGHPVVAWGYSVKPSADSWNVPGGGTVTTYKGEHVRTIYGVAGSPGNIVGFYIRDPIYGNLYWTPGQLMANMNIFGATSNQTVTVY